MNTLHEIVHFDTPLEVKVFLHKIRSVDRHWHESAEIILVLEGECVVVVDGIEHLMSQNDILFINSSDIHSLESDGNALLLGFQAKFNHLKHDAINPNTRFNVNSMKNPKANYDAIKSYLAQLIKLSPSNDSYDVILMESIILNIYYDLVMHFQEEASITNDGQTKKQLSKLQEIIRYIKEHYKEDLSLEGLASTFHFSKHYFSRYFEKYMGITFKKYVDDLRFSNAINLVKDIDIPLYEIALMSGFPNSRSFVKIFKERYQQTPSEYRDNPKNTISTSTKTTKDLNYLEMDQKTSLSKIARFLERETPKQSRARLTTEDAIDIDVTHSQSRLIHTFKTFTTVGRASDLLKTEIQKMLTELQKEIGFKFIKFHGIFDDALMVYTKSPSGKININFSTIDKILDFLLSIQLKPLIQLSFMPKELAKKTDRTIFAQPFIVSEPKNMNDWNHLVRLFTIHLHNRYGKQEVESWLFSLWNEPETSTEMFGFDSDDIYYTFFKNTYETVKSVNPNLVFGASSNMIQTLFETDWFKRFTEATKDHPIDFINIHFYPLEVDKLDINKSQWQQQLTLSKNPDVLNEKIKLLKQSLILLKLDHLPVYLTEWNSTTSHRDLLNDTAYKGAFVVKNIVDNYDALDSFGYWSLTDLIDELPHDTNLFHGGLGLFTANGIKKPAFYGFRFLSELGNDLLSKGKNHIATNNDGELVLVLHNYTHYSDLYASGEIFDMTYTNRYTPFISTVVRRISFNFKGLNNGKYLVTEKIVSPQYGSIYDKWIEVTDQIPIDYDNEFESLSANCAPYYKRFVVQITNETLFYHCSLKPHEIRLVKFKPLY